MECYEFHGNSLFEDLKTILYSTFGIQQGQNVLFQSHLSIFV